MLFPFLGQINEQEKLFMWALQLLKQVGDMEHIFLHEVIKQSFWKVQLGFSQLRKNVNPPKLPELLSNFLMCHSEKLTSKTIRKLNQQGPRVGCISCIWLIYNKVCKSELTSSALRLAKSSCDCNPGFSAHSHEHPQSADHVKHF